MHEPTKSVRCVAQGSGEILGQPGRWARRSLDWNEQDRTRHYFGIIRRMHAFIGILAALCVAHETNGITHLTPWQVDDILPIECPLLTGDGQVVSKIDQHNMTEIVYGPAPTCLNTGNPFSVIYGVDTQANCLWAVDEAFYQFLRNVVSGHAKFQCRVPLSKDKSIFVPFPLTLWGIAEPTHIHIMNHMNHVFHVLDGFILGCSAYALRDQFTPLFAGTLILMHGPVHWFLGHTYESVNSDKHESTPGSFIILQQQMNEQSNNEAFKRLGGGPAQIPIGNVPTITALLTSIPKSVFIFYVSLSSAVTFGICLLVYIGHLKPAIIAQYRKEK